ncbi:MAG: hypothetical protein IIB06_08310 [Bacteroidetes bacterium]|nr:hypothetical protein [Bacteroidota bacterium]
MSPPITMWTNSLTEKTFTVEIIHDSLTNLQDDEIEWLEVFDDHDQKVIESETENLIQEATDFYDREVARFKDD